jgi:hypothetical protein
MADCVLDATVVAMANGDIAARRAGNVLDRRLAVLEAVVGGVRRLRYNRKLLEEYRPFIRAFRNDVIEVFVRVLADRGVLVSRNTLRRQEHAAATRRCRWPTHDQHLLAAAVGGDDPTIFVTEARLAVCAAAILAHFAVHVVRLS